MGDLVLIAQIKSVYNSEGFLLIDSFTDFPDRFYDLESAFINIFGVTKKIFIEEVVLEDSIILLKLKNFDDGSSMQALIGAKIFIDEKHLVKLDINTFFIHDLIGSEVFADNLFFGRLTDILSLDANDVYVISDKDNNEILIPAIKEYILSVDVNKKRIDIIKPEIIDDDED